MAYVQGLGGADQCVVLEGFVGGDADYGAVVGWGIVKGYGHSVDDFGSWETRVWPSVVVD